MTLRIDSQKQVVTATLTTASSDLTDAIDLGGYRLAAITMTTAWTAGNITFVASPDGTTYRNLYGDTGGEVTVVGTQAATIAIGGTVADWLAAHRYIKLRSGTSALGVNQTTERTLTLSLMPA